MELLHLFVDYFLHLDQHLNTVIQTYGMWTYLILFLIVFCETGLVVTPLLPGDSLLFAAGAFAAMGSLDVKVVFVLLGLAAIGGDTANYWIGNYIGPRVFHENVRFLRRDYLDRTHRFYERHGGKTIILARFVPVVRTFAPFVAGVGSMRYGRFLAYNAVGGIAWIALFVCGGFFFGNIPSVKHNFTLVILGIIFVSILPGVIEFVRQRVRRVAVAAPEP